MSSSIPSLRQAMRRFSRLSATASDASVRTITSPPLSSYFSHSARSLARRKPISPQCLFASSRRAFHTSPRRSANIEQSTRTKHGRGVRIFLRAALFVATGAAMIFYFQYEKARLERKRIVEMSKGYGKPKVGGPFILRDLEGNEFTEKDLLGKYTLIYFGFSHCPDICPDELDKMSAAIDIVHAKAPHTLRSIFITCDPARDTPAVLRDYLSEFHPSLLGLTGSWEQVKNVCKQYRVYFSTPPELKPGEEDYLVDHSIYFYVMDPEGDFVECIGRQDTPESAAGIVLQHVRDWRKEGKPIDTTPLPYLNVQQPPSSPLAAVSATERAGVVIPA